MFALSDAWLLGHRLSCTPTLFSRVETMPKWSEDDHCDRQDRRLFVIYSSRLFVSWTCVDLQVIALKALFSTSYILQSKHQSRNIRNIDDLTNQVSQTEQSVFSSLLSFLCSWIWNCPQIGFKYWRLFSTIIRYPSSTASQYWLFPLFRFCFDLSIGQSARIRSSEISFSFIWWPHFLANVHIKMILACSSYEIS